MVPKYTFTGGRYSMDYYALLHRIIKETNLIENVYDDIRLVEPTKKIVYSNFKNNSIQNTMQIQHLPTSCYHTWGNGTACENCISARALIQNKTLVKIELQNNTVFLITSIPVEIEDQRIVIELYKDITKSGILAIEGKSSAELQKLVKQKNIGIMIDALTRIYNEEFIRERLPYDIHRAREENKPLALIYVEIENVDTISNLYGDPAKDYIVKEIAKIIRSYCRDSMDWTARLYTNAYLILLNNSDERQTYQVCKRLHDRLDKKEFIFQGKRIKIEKRIGWHVSQNEDITVRQLMNKALDRSTTEMELPDSENLEQTAHEFFRDYYLTAREAEIAILILKGYSNAQIARELFVGIPTVKKHISAIFDKSDSATRNEFSAKYREAVL